MKKILLILGIILGGLWGAQYYWIDKEPLPMPRMPSWKISVLKVSRLVPWPASSETHLDRTIKLSNAILHQEEDKSLKSSLLRFNEALKLLAQDIHNYDLTQYPDLAYRRLLGQIILMHRGAYFLVKAGRQVEIKEGFNRLESAFQQLANPTHSDQIEFYVEKMIHEAILNRDIPRAKEIMDELLGSASGDASANIDRMAVGLYFGYALCLSKNQEGADYIQTSISSLPRTVVIHMAAVNWDTGLLGGIVLENQEGTSCRKAVESVLTLMKS